MTNGSISPKVRSPQRWVVATGATLGTLTLLFLMALVLMAAFGNEVPAGSRFLVVSVLAFGAGLASAFLGGAAAATGRIALPLAYKHPLEFSATGGIGVLLLVMVLGNTLYGSNDQPKALPSGHVVLFDGWSRSSESGFKFASQTIVPWNSGQADILVSNSRTPGLNAKLFVQYQVPPFDKTPQDQGARGGIVQLTHSLLNDVSECPTEGYSAHWTEARVNGVYCLRTRDGTHYAKLKVSDVLADRIAFDWVFQPSGSPKFR